MSWLPAISSGYNWAYNDYLNQFSQAVAWRYNMLYGSWPSGIVTFAYGTDCQHYAYINRLQELMEAVYPMFISSAPANYGGTGTYPMGQRSVYSTMWRRADSSHTSPNTYGRHQAGDVIGPWIWEDLRARIDECRYMILNPTKSWAVNSDSLPYYHDDKSIGCCDNHGNDISTDTMKAYAWRALMYSTVPAPPPEAAAARSLANGIMSKCQCLTWHVVQEGISSVQDAFAQLDAYYNKVNYAWTNNWHSGIDLHFYMKPQAGALSDIYGTNDESGGRFVTITNIETYTALSDWGFSPIFCGDNYDSSTENCYLRNDGDVDLVNGTWCRYATGSVSSTGSVSMSPTITEACQFSATAGYSPKWAAVTNYSFTGTSNRAACKGWKCNDLGRYMLIAEIEHF